MALTRRTTAILLVSITALAAFFRFTGLAWGSFASVCALFPDAAHPKARTGLRRLTELAREGHHAAALFLVQRGEI